MQHSSFYCKTFQIKYDTWGSAPHSYETGVLTVVIYYHRIYFNTNLLNAAVISYRPNVKILIACICVIIRSIIFNF